MSIKSKVLGAAATLALVGGVVAFGPVSAQAGTSQCGSGCINVFSPRFGSSAQPNFVESVRHGEVKVGQAIILGRASSTDPAGDSSPSGERRAAWCLTSSLRVWSPQLSTATTATFPRCNSVRAVR